MTDQRYYNANYGTFWSPDPGGLATADPSNPTSWNRYAYVYDDPVNFTDIIGAIAQSAESGLFPAFLPAPQPAPESGPNPNPDPVPPPPPGPTPPAPPTVNQQLLVASKKRIVKDLNNANCAKDFSSTVDTTSELDEISFKDAGPLQYSTNRNGVPRLTGGWLGEYNGFTGSIYLNSNSSVNWANPTDSTYVLNGQVKAGDLIAGEIAFLGLPQGTTMTPNQFMDLVVLHELAHYDGTVGNPDNAKNELKLWNDCVK